MRKDQIKEMIFENLCTKRIVLFGAGILAKEFYNKYKDKLNFAFCVTNDIREWGDKKFCGELDIKQYSKQNIGSEYYVVLCNYFSFGEISIQLDSDDFIVFEEYVDSKIAESILDNKKLLFFYGSCILRDIYYYMKNIPAFMDKYTSVFLQVKPEETMFDVRRLYNGRKVCDVYVYARKLIDLSKPYNMQREDLPADCKMIGVSNVTFNGYWPQIVQDIEHHSEEWIFRLNERFDSHFWHLMYCRKDANITELVKKGKWPEEIYEIVSAEDFYEEKDIKKYLRICFKTLKMAERGLDVKIGDFIINNYKEELLYQDFTHPKKKIAWEYVKQILACLDVKEPKLKEIEQESPEYMHQASDIPVYPSVARILGMDWIKDETKYEVLTYRGVEFMTFRDYVIHYAQYIKQTLEIRRGW